MGGAVEGVNQGRKGKESKLDHGAPLKEDAGREDYDLRFTATLARLNLPDGTDDARHGNWESQMAVKRVPLS
jgi:hypothetical protein